MGFQGQTGNYTDTETLHAAAGLYTALSGPGGIYYSPESGAGMARSRADAANTYDQLLHPLDGWTFGAYAHEVGQFGIGEAKGTVNFVAGTVVSLSPELEFADAQTGGRLSAPIATTGTQAAGSGFIQPVLFVATFFVDPEEVAALGGKGAKLLGQVVRAGDHCFVAGTLVQMADGTTRPIEQVQVGDLVKSRNAQTGKVEAKRVDRTYVRVAPQVVALTFTDGTTHQAEAFTCTPEHPFYVDGRGYVQASQLGIGTSIVTRAGPALTLSAASWSALPAPATGLALGDGQSGGSNLGGYHVYNLRVEDDHSYFVGTIHGGTCVHNADYPILFGQARADAAFSTKAEVPANLKGRLIDDVVSDLQSGALSPDDIRIEAFQHEGQLVSTNTRGLAALSKAGLKPTNVVMRAATRAEKSRLNETSALGHKLPSQSLAITPSRTDHTILDTIHIPR